MSTATAEVQLDELQRHLLEHTLNAGPTIPVRKHGERNGFCVKAGSPAHGDMLALVQLGFMRVGARINFGTDQYFHATAAGCDAIGLSSGAKKRALET